MKNKTAEKIKVLFVAPSMRAIGGQSVQAKHLLEAFENDEEVEMEFLPIDPKLNVFGFLQNIKYARTVVTSIKYWRLLFEKVRKSDFVLVSSAAMSGYTISTLPPLFAAKFYGKKVVLNYHSGEAEHHIKTAKRTALPSMKKFDEIVVPSQFLVDVFAKYNLEANVIFNFVETEKFVFRERKPLRPVFLSNRNFEKHYSVGDILRAFQIIEQKILAAKLIVAGYGSEEVELKKLAKNLGLKNVEFVGRVEQSEMPKIYDRADIYLNSSIVDNAPLSIIEAFACGLPVVSTNAGGITYLVENEKNGLLVEMKDYKSLAEAAIRLLGNDELAQRLISNARKECEKYAWAKVGEDWRKFYFKMRS